ncbi:MAG: hypothetical protein IJY62_05075 [Clostridia bacterium]|nr:hypothetical protein [Clostridia bacterium]
MSKLLNKTVTKRGLWAIVCAAVLVAGLIVGLIFGFNASATTASVKTLTVQINSYAGDTETVETVERVANSKIKALKLNKEYVVEGEIADGNVYEFIYVFDEKTSDETLAKAETSIKEAIDKKESEGALGTAFVGVTTNSEAAVETLAKGFVWRGIVAAAVVLVFVFVYTAIRFKPLGGAMVTGAGFISLLLTTAIASLVRIPVTATFAYAAAFSVLFASAVAAVVVGTARKAFKAEENKEKDNAAVVAESVSVKEIFGFSIVLAVAALLVGMVSTTAVQWFTVAAVVAIASGLFAALFVMPAWYVAFKAVADKKAAAKARYDYKKGE